MPDSKVHAFAGGFRGSGGSPGLPQRGRKIITHTKDPSWICPSSGTPPLRCPNIVATPSLLIQLESVDKTTLSMRMRDPSEKIHSQIRRPSFSDSLLTRDSKRVLTGPQKHYLGPKRALPRTRRVSDSKMLPTSGQDSFCWSNHFIRSPEARRSGGGAAYAVSRQVCIAAVSGSVTLSVRTAPL